MSTCGWIDEGRNLLISRKSSSGKTYLANALSVAALRQFKTVRYIKASRLMNELEQARIKDAYEVDDLEVVRSSVQGFVDEMQNLGYLITGESVSWNEELYKLKIVVVVIAVLVISAVYIITGIIQRNKNNIDIDVSDQLAEDEGEQDNQGKAVQDNKEDLVENIENDKDHPDIANHSSDLVVEDKEDENNSKDNSETRHNNETAEAQKASIIENEGDICILRSPADSDAFQSGRYAEHNGRSKTLEAIA